MKYYNLYYKDSKLNNRPVTEMQLDTILNQKHIYKRNSITNKIEDIPTNQIQIIKTILI
jgi:hypothetical protein